MNDFGKVMCLLKIFIHLVWIVIMYVMDMYGIMALEMDRT